ncbi:DUF4157 domain-containing protein [Streptomyces sp. NPDC006435]|uniref:eCIS core domain-containing protein n=1 Tax=Streptomyces sp. NPDC006435 TaxID=3154300 RepID=UPI0033B9548C
MDLQATVGNDAVVQMLRRAGQLSAEQHGHGVDHGHAQSEVVQRSTVHDVLRSPGRPLDEATRIDMEDRLGADFSDVRVHDDTAARASAAEVGARAYTSGHHVVIGDGGADEHTLAHELTHVIQQRTGPVAGTDNGAGLRVSSPTDRYEREAEANATRAMRPAPAPTASARPTGKGRPSRPAPAVGPRNVQRTKNNQMSTSSVYGRVAAGEFGEPAAEDDVPGIISLTPALLRSDLNLAKIAERYRTGFPEDATGIESRFALVIGVNCWEGESGKEKLLREKIKEFEGVWKKDAFKVEVIGFSWSNPVANEGNKKEQNIIPYGSIRERIMRDEAVKRLIIGLRKSGRKHVYVHTSDSDTQSFKTQAGPLFSSASSQGGPLGGTDPMDIFSGGYTGLDPNSTPEEKEEKSTKSAKKVKKVKKPKKPEEFERDLMFWNAAQVDLAIRDAMARQKPSSVYYPEPNTFVKVHDELDELEDGISFEQGSQEGAALVKSARNEISNRGTEEVREGFDSRYAITTDMERIGRKVGTGLYSTKKPVTKEVLEQLSELSQSHSNQITWQDRIEDAYGLPAGMAASIGKIVYAGVHDPKILGEDFSEDTVKKYILDEIKKDKTLLKDLKDHKILKEISKMAFESRKVLLDAFTRARDQLSRAEE